MLRIVAFYRFERPELNEHECASQWPRSWFIDKCGTEAVTGEELWPWLVDKGKTCSDRWKLTAIGNWQRWLNISFIWLCGKNCDNSLRWLSRKIKSFINTLFIIITIIFITITIIVVIIIIIIIVIVITVIVIFL